MKLRFEVNQVESFRLGVDCPKSIVTIDVAPAKLSQADRDLIADRMNGIDVVSISHDLETPTYPSCDDGSGGLRFNFVKGTKIKKPNRLVSKLPTYDALMEAVLENERLWQEQDKAIKDHP